MGVGVVIHLGSSDEESTVADQSNGVSGIDFEESRPIGRMGGKGKVSQKEPGRTSNRKQARLK